MDWFNDLLKATNFFFKYYSTLTNYSKTRKHVSNKKIYLDHEFTSTEMSINSFWNCSAKSKHHRGNHSLCAKKVKKKSPAHQPQKMEIK